MHTATVLDYAPAQLRRTIAKKPSVVTQAAFSIFDDFADGIEAMHQCMNLAGFSERSRAFIMALASAAHSHGKDFVKLFDEDLAELQNCSTKTIQRQRKFYMQESQKLNFVPVEIQEGKFNQDTQRNEPTEYRFHLGEIIEQIVVEARASKWWHNSDRDKQREAIKRAAQSVYDEIPEAKSKRRKEKRPRLAVAEIETCLKVIETKLNTVKEFVSKLPFAEHDRIMNPETPGDAYAHLLKLRAKIDNLLNVNFPQATDDKEVKVEGRQFVHPPLSMSTLLKSLSAQTPAEPLKPLLMKNRRLSVSALLLLLTRTSSTVLPKSQPKTRPTGKRLSAVLMSRESNALWCAFIPRRRCQRMRFPINQNLHLSMTSPLSLKRLKRYGAAWRSGITQTAMCS